MDIIEYAEKICGRRWVIAKESELSKTSIIPFPHKGFHSRICIIDETVIDNQTE